MNDLGVECVVSGEVCVSVVSGYCKLSDQLDNLTLRYEEKRGVIVYGSEGLG